MEQLPLGVQLKERATFASFHVGTNEQLVRHLERVGGGALNGATWLAGPAGVGKSHLLQATCSLAGSRRPGRLFPAWRNSGSDAGIHRGRRRARLRLHR
ncbi:MAG: hypothetical protein R3E72_00140 [Steroidobacteraceae bacterium]